MGSIEIFSLPQIGHRMFLVRQGFECQDKGWERFQKFAPQLTIPVPSASKCLN